MKRFWTDGCCFPNPGKGGWAWTDLDGTERSGGEKQTTNQRMEMLAVIDCLEFCSVNQISAIVIVSDSQYVIKGATSWRNKWEKNGWKNSTGKPVANKDLWTRMFRLSDELKARFEWVRGHTGDAGNERADALAIIGSGCTKEEIEKASKGWRKSD